MLRKAHNPKYATSSVKHGAVWRHEHAWIPVALGYMCYWWRDRGQKQPKELWSVQGYTLCPDSAKWNKVDWTALHSTNGWWPKTYSKSNPGVFEGKKFEYSEMSKLISWSQPDWACISLAENKTKGRKTHKQTKTEVSCSKGLAKHHKGGNSMYVCMYVIQKYLLKCIM